MTSISDKSRSECPSTTLKVVRNVEIIPKIILTDGRRTIEEVDELSGVTWSSIQRILVDNFRVKGVPATIVHRLLNIEQK